MAPAFDFPMPGKTVSSAAVAVLGLIPPMIAAPGPSAALGDAFCSA